MSLTDEIKRLAQEAGFDAVGISLARRLDVEGDRLLTWLAGGYHASMEWMERNIEWRLDPSRYFYGGESVISVALSYYVPGEFSSSESRRGRISRYAWGADYHKVMWKKLSSFADAITAIEPDAHFKTVCDTAPVMDKVWAAEAGIGWLGKHTNLITKELGSWVFLGEIITDLELVPDIPSADFCGSCTACIDACPTGAIVEPYVVDSNLCISYLTIEHTGEFPPESPSLHGWLFGCDVCQDVCPWNSKAQATKENDFYPGEVGVDVELERISAMSEEEFNSAFERSPVRRTKLEGFVRNARKVLSEMLSE